MAVLNDDQKRWLDALYYGRDFVQGQHSMAFTDDQGRERHCCMGVACVLFGYELVPDEPDAEKRGVRAEDVSNPPGSGVVHSRMPDGVAARLNLSEDDQLTLAGMNDSGWSYLEIARVMQYVWLRDLDLPTVYDQMGELHNMLDNLRFMS